MTILLLDKMVLEATQLSLWHKLSVQATPGFARPNLTDCLLHLSA